MSLDDELQPQHRSPGALRARRLHERRRQGEVYVTCISDTASSRRSSVTGGCLTMSRMIAVRSPQPSVASPREHLPSRAMAAPIDGIFGNALQCSLLSRETCRKASFFGQQTSRHISGLDESCADSPMIWIVG